MGGLVALLVLAGVGVIYYLVDWQISRQRDPNSGDYQKAYQEFLEDIEADRLDAAYHSTTASFQRQVSRGAFEETVRGYLAFKRKPDTQCIEAAASGPAGGDYHGPNRMTFTYTLEDKDKNRLQSSITVLQEDSILYRRPPPPRVAEFTVAGP
jgi:hypothetical protein